MCSLCHTLHRFAPHVPESSAMQSLNIALDELGALHAWKAKTRARVRSIPDATRFIQSAVYAFAAVPSFANYSVIRAEIANYWRARQVASDARKANLLNPDGKSEPRAEPRAHYAPVDSCIYGQRLNSPDRIVSNVDSAVVHAARHLRNAERLLQRNYPDKQSRLLAKNIADDLTHDANEIEETLHVYKSTLAHNSIRRSVADDVVDFVSCYH